MISLLQFLIASFAFSQTAISPLIDTEKLSRESLARSVFIRAFLSKDTTSPVKSTGIILKGGFIITNEHVMRPHLDGKKVAFHIFTNGKRGIHKFENVMILGCDHENDICLLKTENDYGDSFFSLEAPPFRTLGPDKPVGLFKDEAIQYNGFCKDFPKMTKVKYVGYTESAYENIGFQKRKSTTAAIQFAGETGQSIACGGDSGGPLFDQYLYLYGMVRDSITDSSHFRKNYAIPATVIREFVSNTKNSESKNQIKTIMSFSELETIFK
jgi:S1-C subfamily serine protease